MKPVESIDADVLIVGGGLVGGTLGCLLAGQGISTVIVDRAKPSDQLDPEYDGRASAIALGTQRVLSGAGLWDDLQGGCSPIDDIRVSDGDSMMFLHYDHRDLDIRPFGYMVENRHLRVALAKRFAALQDLTLMAPGQIESLERTANGIEASLDSGQQVCARLVIGADGRASQTREDAGIDVTKWSYNQSGIVCTVHHERSHEHIAHERFLPAGPFAILPLKGHRSCIVWTERKDLAPAMMDLNGEDFAAELTRRFGTFLGDIEVTGPRWCYPLSLQFARKVVDDRLVLVGDAAHAMHPIAGQGLNMGLRDAAAMAEVLCDAHRLGRDLGSGAVLARYERWRRFDNTMMLAMTDLLNRLFSNDIAPVRTARDMGLAIVNRIPPLKRFFMRHAMGLVGDLPKLMRGEPL